MKVASSAWRQKAGLSVVEILVVVATLMIAAAVLVPALCRKPGSESRCVGNLKQIGVAFIEWSHDRESGFPWTTPEKQGGTSDYAASREVFRHFQVASNELDSPRILVCPQDGTRRSARTFEHLSNENVSYLIALDADGPNANTILCADRSLGTNRIISAGLLTIPNTKSIRWAEGMHQDAGNILWADGSVTTVDQLDLRKLLQERASFPARLNVP